MLNAFGYKHNDYLSKSQQKFVDGSCFIPSGKPDYDTDFTPNRKFFDVEIKDFEIVHKPIVKNSADIAKVLLRQRITGQSGVREYIPPDLHLTEEEIRQKEFEYQENIIKSCGKNAIMLKGESSGSDYFKLLDCHKQWCPKCGGKKGKIHKNRIHSILKRLDVKRYGIRQLIFTLPEDIRENFKTRESLDRLFKIVKRIIEKFYGVPQFDKKGHIKRYKLEKGVIFYLHIFGDMKKDENGLLKYDGKYHPHINVHIFESLDTKLKEQSSVIESIKRMWLKLINKEFGLDLQIIDMQYLFKLGEKKALHSIKYMTKPFGHDEYQAAPDDLKKFIVLDLKNFMFVRFYGALANCNYKDEMILSEKEEDEIENIIGEKLIKFGTFGIIDLTKWGERLELIADGLYRIRGENKDEWEKSQKKKKND